MNTPTPDSDRHDGQAAPSWNSADYNSDATQVVRAPAGGYDPAPSPAAEPAYTPPSAAAPAYTPPAYTPPARDEPADPFSTPMPVVSPGVGAQGGGADTQVDVPPGEPGGWSPANSYPPQPAYSAQPAMTSVYPPSNPGYAPAGYPAAYAPPAAVPAPIPSMAPATTSSRVGPAFLAALIGLLLAVGGVYLAAKFGVAAATDFNQQKVVIKDAGLTAAGAILLLAAVGLNGWSPWSTIVPGVALTGIGGWTLFSVSGAAKVADWTKSVFSAGEFSTWSIVGFTLTLGLVMLGASVAAAMARAAGKKDGHILGSRQP